MKEKDKSVRERIEVHELVPCVSRVEGVTGVELRGMVQVRRSIRSTRSKLSDVAALKPVDKAIQNWKPSIRITPSNSPQEVLLLVTRTNTADLDTEPSSRIQISGRGGKATGYAVRVNLTFRNQVAMYFDRITFQTIDVGSTDEKPDMEEDILVVLEPHADQRPERTGEDGTGTQILLPRNSCTQKLTFSLVVLHLQRLLCVLKVHARARKVRKPKALSQRLANIGTMLKILG